MKVECGDLSVGRDISDPPHRCESLRRPSFASATANLKHTMGVKREAPFMAKQVKIKIAHGRLKTFGREKNLEK